MTEESKSTMRAAKSARIIMAICELHEVPIQVATDIFYRSKTADMIEQGVSDLQCRSDKYLASLIWEEHQEAGKG